MMSTQPQAGKPGDLDSITKIYASLQLTCMLLQYAISIEMKRDIALGMKMLVDYEKLRALFMDEEAKMQEVFTQYEITQSYERTGFYQTIYSHMDDAALALNQKYFPMPRRPQGVQYACSEQACKELAIKEAKKFFPSLYKAQP